MSNDYPELYFVCERHGRQGLLNSSFIQRIQNATIALACGCTWELSGEFTQFNAHKSNAAAKSNKKNYKKGGKESQAKKLTA